MEAVYGDVVRFSLLQPDHGLHVLGFLIRPAANWKHITSTHNGLELPSWMPDFRDQLGLSPFCTKVRCSRAAYDSYSPHRTHNVRIEGFRFILDGIRIDQTSTLSATWEENAFGTAEVCSWASRNPDTSYAPTSQTLDEAFRTTVLADTNP